MELLPFFVAVIKPLLLSLLGLAAVVGAVGAISPRALALTVAAGNRWVDTWRFFRVPEKSLLRRLDTWVDLDGVALRHGRAVGISVLAAAVLLGYVCVTCL